MRFPKGTGLSEKFLIKLNSSAAISQNSNAIRNLKRGSVKLATSVFQNENG